MRFSRLRSLPARVSAATKTFAAAKAVSCEAVWRGANLYFSCSDRNSAMPSLVMSDGSVGKAMKILSLSEGVGRSLPARHDSDREDFERESVCNRRRSCAERWDERVCTFSVARCQARARRSTWLPRLFVTRRSFPLDSRRLSGCKRTADRRRQRQL